MHVPASVKMALKRSVKSLIYRFPPAYLSPAGLHLWFEALLSTREMDGDILEVGCYLGATAALSARYLAEIGCNHRYYVLDTFRGYVDEQVAGELVLGGTDRHRYDFHGNAPELARWVMDRHGGASVTMIVGDVTRVPERMLPERIVACLIDIHLAEPIYAALRRIYPRMLPGGYIIVDDCDDRTDYKARIGYERFVDEMGLPRKLTFGKGIVRVPQHPGVPQHQATAEPASDGAR